MARTLTDDDVEAIAQRVAALMGRADEQSPALRNVYTCEQFAAEILCGNRHPNWVRQECKRRGGIKTVGRRPYLIPQSEAVRFISPSKT